MRTIFAILLVAVAVAGCASSGYGPSQSSTPTAATPAGSTTPISPTASSADIHLSHFAFSPASYSEELGGTVSWVNDDNVTHTVTADDGSFDSGPLAPGQSFTHAFATAGTFAYHCKIHPSMKASIVVGNATATTPAPSPSPSPNAGAITVHIADFTFGSPVSVPAGATVTWINDGARTHTVSADDGSFSSGNLAPGATFSHAFMTPGTFGYHCSIHSSMTSSVTVT